MSDNFEKLLESPLDEPRGERGAGWYLLGGLIGIVAAVGLVALFATIRGGGPQEAPSASSTEASSTSSTAPLAVVEASSFPDGYVALSQDTGVKPIALVRADGRFVVTVALSTRRGVDPLVAVRPLGGRWEIERDGARLEPTRVITDRFRPGVYSVEFEGVPLPGDVLHMTERWDPVTIEQEVTVPYADDAPYVLPDDLTVALTDDVTMAIVGQLGRFMGELAWELQGSTAPLGIATVDVVLVDAVGEQVGGYGSAPASLDAAVAADALQVFWVPSFPIDQTGAVDVDLRIRSQLASRVPVDIRIDLSRLALVGTSG